MEKPKRIKDERQSEWKEKKYIKPDENRLNNSRERLIGLAVCDVAINEQIQLKHATSIIETRHRPIRAFWLGPAKTFSTLNSWIGFQLNGKHWAFCIDTMAPSILLSSPPLPSPPWPLSKESQRLFRQRKKTHNIKIQRILRRPDNNRLWPRIIHIATTSYPIRTARQPHSIPSSSPIGGNISQFKWNSIGQPFADSTHPFARSNITP